MVLLAEPDAAVRDGLAHALEQRGLVVQACSTLETVADAALVGTCAFATSPEEGEAEIAYYTFPPYEGSGLGTAMAAALIEIARQGDLNAVSAKTLPQESVSTHILRRLGFDLEGPVMDEEDGEVWRWRLAL